MTKSKIEPQKLVIFTNALLLVLGTLVNASDAPGKDFIMSIFFTVWAITFVWYIVASKRQAV